jgi:hypothetical protein
MSKRKWDVPAQAMSIQEAAQLAVGVINAAQPGMSGQAFPMNVATMAGQPQDAASKAAQANAQALLEKHHQVRHHRA